MLPPLAIIGLGRMGRAVADVARDEGWSVVASIGRSDGLPTAELLNGAAVAVEFTTAAAAPDVVRACAGAGCAVVSGTTGWLDRRARVEAEVRAAGGALLWSPNFALGIQILWRVAAQAAALAAGLSSFDAHIVETHHAAKRDAPSGTAIELARIAGAARGAPVPVTSVRVGAVPGTHELVLDGGHEQLRIVHEARDRRVFADGALVAARWLAGRRGVFTMDDVLRWAERAGEASSRSGGAPR